MTLHTSANRRAVVSPRYATQPYRPSPGRREHIHGRIRGMDDASPHPLAKLVIVLGLIGGIAMWIPWEKLL